MVQEIKQFEIKTKNPKIPYGGGAGNMLVGLLCLIENLDNLPSESYLLLGCFIFSCGACKTALHQDELRNYLFDEFIYLLL